MKVKTTKRHYEKYKKLCEKFNLDAYFWHNEMLGISREKMTALLEEDGNLNNVSLRRWNMASSPLFGRKHTININGEDDGKERGMSKAEAVCCLKFAARYYFVGAEPEFED